MSELQKRKPVIVVHGGAGNISPEYEKDALDAIRRAAIAGYLVLKAGGTSLDAVEASIKVLEDAPVCNAGRGSVLTTDRRVEMDASIMRGADLASGAIAGVSCVKNPISLARQVMEKTPHCLFAGEGAEKFAHESGVEIVNNEYLVTEKSKQSLERFIALSQKKSEEEKYVMNLNKIGVTGYPLLNLPSTSSTPSISTTNTTTTTFTTPTNSKSSSSSSSSSSLSSSPDTSTSSSLVSPTSLSPSTSLTSPLSSTASCGSGTQLQTINNDQDPTATTTEGNSQHKRLYGLAVLGDFDESFNEKGLKNQIPGNTDTGRSSSSNNTTDSSNVEDYNAGHDTVGCVAFDIFGKLAAGTSTGGITGKRPGRVGDSPIIGSGLYADDESAAVSTTGHGESLMRVCLAKRVCDGLISASSSSSPSSLPPTKTPSDSALEALEYMRRRINGSGGLICIDRWGRACAKWSTPMMSWAKVDEDGILEAGITTEPSIREQL